MNRAADDLEGQGRGVSRRPPTIGWSEGREIRGGIDRARAGHHPGRRFRERGDVATCHPDLPIVKPEDVRAVTEERVEL